MESERRHSLGIRGIELAGWCLLALALVCWWARLAVGESPHHSLANADHAYPAGLVEDLLAGGALGEWRFAPAPYFVPDVFLYALFRLVFGTFETARALSTMAQCLLVVLSARRAMRALLGAPGLPVALVPAVFAAGVSGGLAGVGVFDQLTLTAIHSGALFLALCSMALSLSGEGPRWTAGLAVVAILGGVSDGLYIVGWSAPTALAALVGAVAAQFTTLPRSLFPPLRRALIALICSVGGSLIPRVVVPYPVRGHMQLRLGQVLTTLTRAAADWASFPWQVRALVLGGLAFSIGLLWWFGRAAAPRQRLARGALLLGAGSAVTLLAILVTGNAFAVGWHRYLLAPTVFGALVMLLPLATVPKPLDVWVGVGAVALAGGLLVSLAAPARWEFRAVMPVVEREQAACLDRIAAEEGVTSGLADYWHSRPLTLFSRKGLKIMSFGSDFCAPYHWAGSKAWYRDDAGFVVADGLNRADIDARLGPPHSTHDCAGLTVLVYRGEARSLLRSAPQWKCDLPRPQ